MSRRYSLERCETTLRRDQRWNIYPDGDHLTEERQDKNNREPSSSNRSDGFNVAPVPSDLHLSLELLQAVVRSSPDAIFAKDLSGKYLIINDAAAQLVGGDADDLLGKTAEAYVPLPEFEELSKLEQEIITSGESIVTNAEFHSEEGISIYEISRGPYRDSNGIVRGIVGIGRDITYQIQYEQSLLASQHDLEERVADRSKQVELRMVELRDAQEALEESHLLLKAVADGTPDAVFLKDDQLRYLLMNSSGAQMVGKTVDEVLGKDDFALYDSQAAKKLQEEDRKVLHTGKPQMSESDVQAAGISRRLHTTKAPYRDHTGKVVGVIGISRDVTENAQAKDALIASESRYRGLFEINPLSTFVVDSDTFDFLDVNDAAMKSYGYSRAEFLHMNLLELHPGADLARLREAPEEMEHDLMEELGSRHRRKDGSLITVEVSWRPLNVDGRPARLVVAYDVTERERAEEQNHALTAELQRSNRALLDFASVASHDLQEPLRKIQTFGDRLKVKLGDACTSEIKDYLERMQNAASRMQKLIDDLLSYSRVTTRQTPFVLTNLDEVARGVVSDLEALIQRTNGTVTVETLPSVYADSSQMRQLLQNLIGNALKFHRPGVAPVVHVSATMTLEDGTPRCYLRVQDNGIGFDEKYADRIFGVFERLHGRSEYEGTGIGLAICQTIARRHGGEISAVSEPNVGSTFNINLPVRQRKAAGP
ncbi:MAG: PAS domain S-box protein [Chthonomonadales bacterium]